MTLARELASQEERLMGCVHCGFCLPACPTYVRLGDEADSPRGRLYLMRAVVEGRLDPESDAFQTHIDRCLGCRACETVCPSGVEYGVLLERARAEVRAVRSPRWLVASVLRVFRSPRLLAATMWVGRAIRATGVPAVLARVLPGRSGMAMGMLASSAPWRGLRAVGSRGASDPRDTAPPPGARPDLPGTASPLGSSAPVALLRGCVQGGLFGHVNAATARVLEANGHSIVPAPGQVCCGALHAHAGALDQARALARANVRAFETSGAELIVVNAAGCGAALKEYGDLLRDDPELAAGARSLAERVRDVSEVLSVGALRRGAAIAVRAAYDAPCHLRHAQQVDEAPLRMLGAVPGLEVTPVAAADECCGGAGIYGITHPELGGRIGADKVRAVVDVAAPVLVTGNPGCIMQIGAGLRRRGTRIAVAHPVELLDESYRRAGYYAPG